MSKEKNETSIRINKEQYTKLALISEQIGMSIEEIVEIQIKHFLEAIKQEPLSELENLEFEERIKKAFK